MNSMQMLRLPALLAAALLATAGSVQAQGTATPAATMVGSGPNGATMRCGDGSHPAPNAAASACDGKGGVALRYPMRAQPKPVAAAPQAAPVGGGAQQSARPAAPAVQSWREQTAAAREANRAAMPTRETTLQCRDGSFVARDTSSARCAAHGGVKARFSPPNPAVRLKPRGG